MFYSPGLPHHSPTRASLLSGRATIHTGVYEPFVLPTYVAFNSSCNRPGDGNCLLLPQVLKPLGYENPSMVGKWHLDNMLKEELTPVARGFDSYYQGYWLGEQDYFIHSRMGGYDWHLGNDTDLAANGTYSTYVMTNATVGIIRKHAAEHRNERGDVDAPLFHYHAWQTMHAREFVAEWIQAYSQGLAGPRVPAPVCTRPIPPACIRQKSPLMILCFVG